MKKNSKFETFISSFLTKYLAFTVIISFMILAIANALFGEADRNGYLIELYTHAKMPFLRMKPSCFTF